MRLVSVREQLHQQIDLLPEEVLKLLADFIALVLARRRTTTTPYSEWQEEEWQDFALGQLFREDDNIEYTLADAQEVFRP